MQRELVERAQRGDRESFTALADAAMPRLYHLAHTMLSDSDLADDAVQEALIATWRDLRGLHDPERFEPWLQQILFRTVYRLAKKDRLERGRWRVFASDRPMVPDPSADIADRDQIDRAFRRLKIEYRAALVVHHYLGLDDQGAADTLGIPLGTFKSRLHRATVELRGVLEAERAARDRDSGGIAMTTQSDLDRELSAYLESRTASPVPARVQMPLWRAFTPRHNEAHGASQNAGCQPAPHSI